MIREPRPILNADVDRGDGTIDDSEDLGDEE